MYSDRTQRRSLLTRPEHHPLCARMGRHRVMKAIAWDDGGAEFLYSDGSVFSFCENMGTFVALTPRAESRAGRRDTISNSSNSNKVTDDELYERDTLFTAWTISTFTAKVTEALAVYNRYAVQPRLVHGLLAEDQPVLAWRQRVGMRTLILERSKRCLQRRRLWALAPPAEEKVIGGRMSSGHSPRSSPPHVARTGLSNESVDSAGRRDGVTVTPTAASTTPTVARVELGVEVTLWCAQHCTSLTLQPGGLTFTVRWPAPIEVPAGSEAERRQKVRQTLSSLVPPTATVMMDREAKRTDREGKNSGEGFDDSSSGTAALRQAVRDALERPVLYTFLTQAFPVAQPPPVWAAMLRLAQQLHAETPADECFGSGTSECEEDACVAAAGRAAITECTTVEDGSPATLCLELPPVAPATARQHHYRFSPIEAADAHYLVAGATHLESTTCSLKIHGPAARVRWRYDADPSWREPHAIYWNLHAQQAGMECGGGLSLLSPSCAFPYGANGDAEPDSLHDLSCIAAKGACSSRNNIASAAAAAARVEGSVLAVVREDASAVLATPGARGYTVMHARADGSLRSYHVSADGEVALPPVVNSMEFPAPYVNAVEAESWQWNTGHPGHNATHALFLASEPPIDSASGTAPSVPATLAAMVGQVFHGASGALTDIPCTGVLPRAAAAAAALGRYLPAVGDTALQLSQHALGAARRAREAATRRQCTENNHHTSSRLNERRATVLAAALDASACRPNALQGLSAPSADVSVAFLSSHIDGVGSFTAMTNGVVRASFDDRTLLTLIPGVNDVDEEQLVATCIFRDATRCSARVAQCGPHHAMFRYISFALPFRRYALMRAAERLTGGKMSATASVLFTDFGEGDRRSRITDIESPSASAVTSGGGAGFSSHTRVDGANTTAPATTTTTTTAAENPSFELRLSTWETTLHERAIEQDILQAAEAQRITTLLELNDSLKERNRSLLSEW